MNSESYFANVLIGLDQFPHAQFQRCKAVWAIGNIAGDSQPHRDLCIANDGVSAVLSVTLLPLDKVCGTFRSCSHHAPSFCRVSKSFKSVSSFL